MGQVLEYQSAGGLRRKLGRILFWSGTLLAGLGTAVLIGAAWENLPYARQYPWLDIVLFALGVLAAPVIGGLLMVCGSLVRRGSRVAGLVACGALLLACMLCLGVMVGAVIESIECFRRGVLLDGMITLGGGVGVMGAIGFLCIWLAGRVSSLRRDDPL